MSRDALYEKLKQKGIFSRKYFYPVTSDQACFKNKYRNIDIPVARALASQVLTLPLYEGLSLLDVNRIV
ncbi:MAG: DegT/DnrJ/EryC1/StrS family aminotransferase, partial [Oscillospiraceae bacterium]|nr:DegT/DnrJ/EryC1/StrS family aminotransferase [Oscillospiraceae bacterium]